MKKILMTIAAAFVAVSMSAQVYVGGSVGYKSVSYDGNSKSEFKIIPEVGYVLDESSAIGITLGYSSYTNDDTKLEVAPYYRYKFVQFDKVDLFIDAMVSFQYTKYDEWNNTTFGIGVRPGVAFNASDKISFVAKLGDGLFFESSKDKDVDAVSHFGLNANTLAALEIGMYYNF